MMRLIKKIAVTAALLAALLAGAAAAAAAAMYDTLDDLSTDLDTAWRAARIALYNRGMVTRLGADDVRYLYQSSCYRQCHGEAVMITAALPPAGWIQVVERMRVQEKVEITGREADAIIQYLEGTYPASRSAFSYEARRQTHDAVWRNDMGQGDIYGDVIYATPEYLASIGAENLIEEYGVDRYLVFIVSFTVHESEIEPHNLDELCLLRTPQGEARTAIPWRLRFQTADKHHYEGVISFARQTAQDAQNGWMELVIKQVGGAADRRYRWELPVEYPAEIAAARRK